MSNRFSLLSIGNRFTFETLRIFKKAQFFDASNEYTEEFNFGLTRCGENVIITYYQLKIHLKR